MQRARRDIRRLVNSNSTPISKFVTLTFKENIQSFTYANNEFNKFIKRLKYKLKFNFKYLVVPQFQERGAIHYHVIFFDLPYVPNKQLKEIWGFGVVRINRIDNVDNVGAYVCRYMQKDFDDERLRGQKCYFASRNLNKPIEIKEESRVKEIADFLPAKRLVFENVYSGDYNTVSYKQYNIKGLKR